MARKTNQELCDEFRQLLTHGFYVVGDIKHDGALSATKAWRGDLWRQFRELEDRLCPKPPERP